MTGERGRERGQKERDRDEENADYDCLEYVFNIVYNILIQTDNIILKCW